MLTDWSQAGLNVSSAVKRGVYTLTQNLIVKAIGKLTDTDANSLEDALRDWLGLH